MPFSSLRVSRFHPSIADALSIAFASTHALALSITRSRQNWAVYLDVHTVRFGVRILYSYMLTARACEQRRATRARLGA